MQSKKQSGNLPQTILDRTKSTAAALLLTIASGQAMADDTEVFFGRNSAQPNVLFILDISGSMTNTDDTGTSRLARLKTALTELLNTSNDINVGLMSFNSEEIDLLHTITPITENRTAVLASVDNLVADHGTPTVEALLQAKRYFAGEYLDGEDTYDSPILSECQSNHVVLLTDGLPTGSSATEVQDDLGITTECLDIDEVGFPIDGACGADITNYLNTNDINTDITGDNNVITHTIGFELDEDWPWLSSLSETHGGGGHHTADSTASLVEAFEDIVQVAQTELNTFVSPSITIDRFSGLSHRTDVYLALFKPSARSNWEGNLKRYDYSGTPPVLNDRNNLPAVDPSTGEFYEDAASWWQPPADDGLTYIPDGNTVSLGGAAGQLSATRNVYTHISGELLSDNDVHETNPAITPAMLGVAADEKDDLLKWARGVDVLDYDEDPTTLVRKQIADPLHSQPVLVTYGKTNNKPNSVAFFGTNQGYLHAIDTQTGAEVFSFIPKELLPNLETFYNDTRRVNKLYGLDGDITSWVLDENRDGAIDPSTDHAFIYAGMRRGGNNYYILNVTTKDNPKHVKTILGGPGGDTNFTSLGQTWSKPTIRTVNYNGTRRKVMLFGGGYDPMQDNATYRSPDTIGNAIYMVDALTGDFLWKADASSHPKMIYSIPSDLNVIDINGDGLADQLYVGDMGGQVWRFDFNSTGTGAIAQGGVIADLATDTESGFRKFFNRPDVALIKRADNTGKYLSISIGSGNRAHPLDESVDNRFYMIRQDAVYSAPAGYGKLDLATGDYKPIDESDLYNATANDIDSTNVTTATAAQGALQGAHGWMIELTEPGEKVLSHSITIDNGLAFTTYLPDSASAVDPCSPSIGRSRLYRMDVTDASPLLGVLAANRYSDVPGSGIAPSPNLFFDENGDAYIQQGTLTVDGSQLNNLTRVYWSEQSE